MDDRNENEGLNHGGNRVADVERARDLLIGNRCPQLKERRSRRIGSDAERIEEIGDEPDESIAQAGKGPITA